MNIKDFFTCDTGKLSATRLISIGSFIMAVILACFLIHLTYISEPVIINDVLVNPQSKNTDAIIWIIGLFLGSSGITKVSQKFAENRSIDIERTK
jgi:hypothetical protein